MAAAGCREAYHYSSQRLLSFCYVFAMFVTAQILVVKYFVCNSLFMAVTVVKIVRVGSDHRSMVMHKTHR